ncbi:MAG: hypothetical protein KGI54_15050 [Pseudomonadota bacterium]|nr:hypothetical protein [Pseudomonadota bacterium]
MNQSTDLFGEAPKHYRASAYPAQPGTGPEGRKCRHCKHCYQTGGNRKFYKCDRVKATCSYGTDINSRSPACHLFDGKIC